MPYAINLCDWVGKKDDIGLQILFVPVVDPESQRVVIDKKRIDEIGMRLTCDDERAGAIVEIARKRYERHQLRLYFSKTGKDGWRRV